MQLAGLDLLCSFVDSFLCAFGSDVCVERRDIDRTLGQTLAPVCVDSLAVDHALNCVLEVDAPVRASRDERCVGCGVDHVRVVTNLESAVLLCCGSRSGGVGMLADYLAAAVDQSLSDLSFRRRVVPALSVNYIHSSLGADGFSAEIKSCVTGDNLCKGERGDIAELCLAQLLEFHAGCDTAEVAGFINGCEIVVVVGETFCGGFYACSVAELNFGMFFSHFYYVILEAEASSEYDLAALIYQLLESGCARVVFRYVVLVDYLIFAQTESLDHFLSAEVVVVGITHIGRIGDVYKANLEVFLSYGCDRSGFACFSLGRSGSFGNGFGRLG